jgi:hypothetical protein
MDLTLESLGAHLDAKALDKSSELSAAVPISTDDGSDVFVPCSAVQS